MVCVASMQLAAYLRSLDADEARDEYYYSREAYYLEEGYDEKEAAKYAERDLEQMEREMDDGNDMVDDPYD